VNAFHVVFVCRANHCRSPLAEFLLRAELSARDVDWTVSSAGTRVRPGQPMHPSAARILARHNLDTSAWTSRVITRQIIDTADLLLTADEEQRGAIARLTPTALPRTFTILQYAYLSAFVTRPGVLASESYGSQLLERVNEVRGAVQPMPHSERDLADPMGQSPLKFRRCAATIERAVEQILGGLPSTDWQWPSTASS